MQCDNKLTSEELRERKCSVKCFFLKTFASDSQIKVLFLKDGAAEVGVDYMVTELYSRVDIT